MRNIRHRWCIVCVDLLDRRKIWSSHSINSYGFLIIIFRCTNGSVPRMLLTLKSRMVWMWIRFLELLIFNVYLVMSVSFHRRIVSDLSEIAVVLLWWISICFVKCVWWAIHAFIIIFAIYTCLMRQWRYLGHSSLVGCESNLFVPFSHVALVFTNFWADPAKLLNHSFLFIQLLLK